jgi:hypothetical protein
MPSVVSCIDGFNLYFGLKSQGWERFLWLDVQALSRNLLKPDQILARTKYFTSRVALHSDHSAGEDWESSTPGTASGMILV